MHSGALDGLQESSSAVLDFRRLVEGLKVEGFFLQNKPLNAKLSDALKIATSFHLLMSAHRGVAGQCRQIQKLFRGQSIGIFHCCIGREIQKGTFHSIRCI